MNKKKDESSILIVDDDRDIVTAIETILSMENYKTAHAFSGKECLTYLEKNQPDLILLDYMLPDMTGKEIVAFIRGNETLSHVPIILISAAHGVKDIAQNLPIQAWIEKPFELEKLLQVVAKQL